MSLKHFLQKIWEGIAHLFQGLEHELKVLVPVAIKIVNEIKLINDSPVADIIEQLLKPLGLDPAIAAIREKAKTVLPKIILDLGMIDAINGITDPNAQLQAILVKINLSPNATKNVFYHGLASLILTELSDGNFTWSDATAVAEYYYKHLNDAVPTDVPPIPAA